MDGTYIKVRKKFSIPAIRGPGSIIVAENRDVCDNIRPVAKVG